MQRWIAFTLAAGVVGTAAAEGPQRATTNVGDTYVYAVDQKADRQKFEETVTVTDVGGGRIKTRHVRADRPQETVGEYGPEWEMLLSGTTGTRFEPAARMLDFPLAPGKTWQQSYQTLSTNGYRSQMKMESRVAGLEKLVTPAGEFEAWRVEAKGYLSGLSWQGGFQVQQTLWYAPAIDRIVRAEYKESRSLGANTVTELKTFKRSQ